MIPFIISTARIYAPYLMFPVALIIGTIGYNIEWTIRDRNKSIGDQKPSVESERNERLLKQLDSIDDLTKINFIPLVLIQKMNIE
uniref:Small integral membrane protein 12 n=1 Tax=Sarcoptes scabiei TaxID=52283 RepID=A0A834R338_SARSC